MVRLRSFLMTFPAVAGRLTAVQVPAPDPTEWQFPQLGQQGQGASRTAFKPEATWGPSRSGPEKLSCVNQPTNRPLACFQPGFDDSQRAAGAEPASWARRRRLTALAEAPPSPAADAQLLFPASFQPHE